MGKVPAFAKAFAGRWRIVEMDNWGSDFLDLVGEAHLVFKGAADGEIAFGALKGFLDAQSSSDFGSMFAMSVVSLVPLFIAFLVGQRYLIKGIATTGIK